MAGFRVSQKALGPFVAALEGVCGAERVLRAPEKLEPYTHDEHTSARGEPEAVVLLARQGLRIREEPVNMRQRQAGSSSIGGLKPLYYMVKVSLALILNTFKERPRPLVEGRGEK